MPSLPCVVPLALLSCSTSSSGNQAPPLPPPDVHILLLLVAMPRVTGGGHKLHYGRRATFGLPGMSAPSGVPRGVHGRDGRSRVAPRPLYLADGGGGPRSADVRGWARVHGILDGGEPAGRRVERQRLANVATPAGVHCTAVRIIVCVRCVRDITAVDSACGTCFLFLVCFG